MEKNFEPLFVPQPQKDRISELPDDILVGILSTLEFKEAAQSSILSHRWLNLWTYVPWLHFDATKDQRRFRPTKERRKHMPVFANWVNHVLALHKSFNLREFRIWFQLDKCYQNEIDKWLEYAFGRGVQRLELNLCHGGISDVPDRDRYNFPKNFLEQTSKLGTQLAPKVSFSHVRALYFTAVNISGEAIEGLLLKCPLLEDLRVIGSRVLVNLVVSGPSILLKHLQISNCCCVESITISNTNIVFLRVSDHREDGHLLLSHLPMLSEVWINGRFCNKSMLFSQLACCLSQLTVLTLQATCPEMIMRLYKFPELKNLRRLVLVASCCSDKSLIGLTSLIESCPRLVEFALMLHPLDVEMWNPVEMQEGKATQESLKGLKVLELYGYHGRHTNEVELIKFFVDNAVALEKIVIDPRDITTYYFRKPFESDRAKKSRRHAVENIKGVVPQHVELVLL